MSYTNEFYSGFSFQLTARRRTDESSYLIPFLRKDGEVYSPVKDFSTSAAELKLRYAPNEKFFQTQWNRFPVSLDAPVFTLSHTIAGKGVLEVITPIIIPKRVYRNVSGFPLSAIRILF